MFSLLMSSSKKMPSSFFFLFFSPPFKKAHTGTDYAVKCTECVPQKLTL